MPRPQQGMTCLLRCHVHQGTWIRTGRNRADNVRHRASIFACLSALALKPTRRSKPHSIYFDKMSRARCAMLVGFAAPLESTMTPTPAFLFMSSSAV